ncbi:MAG: tetratricopeptide repeat protein [Bacteroidales bacterium]|nr:tetratricopeptide repeat protein [Bacteroidales bacterium]
MERFDFLRSDISMPYTKVFIRVFLFVVCLFCANNGKAQYNPYYPINPYGYYPTNPYLDAFRAGEQIGKAINDAITSAVQDNIYDRSHIRNNINKWGKCENGALSINHGAVAIYGSNGYACTSVDKRLLSKLEEINNDKKKITDVNITDNGYFIVVYDNGTNWYGVIPSSLSTALNNYPNNTVFRSISFNDATGVYAITTSNGFETNNQMYNECYDANIGTKGQLLSANICNNGCVFCFSGGVVCCGYIPDNLILALNKFTITAQFVKFNRHGDYLICAANGGYSYHINDANACGDAHLSFHNVVVNSNNNGIASNNGARQNTTANTPRNNGNMAGQQTSNSAAEMFDTANQYYKAKNYVEAVKWYRKVAEQGFAPAQYKLGVCYDYGKGVTQSDTEAVKWYRKAAEQGEADAQYELGWCYYEGKGVTQSDTEAVKWYRKAAEQGEADAQYELGWCYYEGKGVTQSDTEAVKWWRKAAEQGYAYAQYKLGLCYYEGKGVTQSYTEALKWLRKAKEQGHEGATKLVPLVEMGQP